MTENTASAGKRDALLTGCISGLFLLFLLQIIAGLALEFRYSATSSAAYADVKAIQDGGLVALRGFHYWSSALLIAGSMLALVWMVIVRWFNGGHNRLWFATALLFLCSLLSQITGNVLPFDRHGVQTAVIESGVARRTPVAGDTIANLILGGPQFNDSTVSRWHLAHIAICILGIAALLLFWVASRGKPRSGMTLAIPPVLAVVLGFAVHAPLGNPATKADYGLFDAQVSWYTWPLHGSLNLFSRISQSVGWIGSAVIPGLFALLIIAAPWIARRAPKAVPAAFFAFVAYFLVAGSFFGGRFAPLVGNRDPALASVKPNQTQPVDQALYAKGRNLFNTNACVGCHGKDGRNGSEGPDLYGVSKRRGTDPQWYMDFIADPQKVKPNTMMPAFPEISQADRRAIAEFLIHQK